MSQKLFYVSKGRLRLKEDIENEKFPFLITLPKKFSDVLKEYTELQPDAILEFVKKEYYESFKGSAGSDAHIAGCIYTSELLTEKYKKGVLAWEGKIAFLNLMPDVILLNDGTEIVEVQSFGHVTKNKRSVLRTLKYNIKDLKLSLAIPDDDKSVNILLKTVGKEMMREFISTVYLHPKGLDDFCNGRKIYEAVKEIPSKDFY